MARSQVLYAKVATRIHDDPWFRSLSVHGQIAFLKLLTSPHQNGLPGFWRATPGMLIDLMAPLTPDDWDRERAKFETDGRLRVDYENRMVWVVNALRPSYNTPDNPNTALSWARKLAQFERCQTLTEYIRALLAASLEWPRGVREAFLEGLESVDIEECPALSPGASPQQEFTLKAPAKKPDKAAKEKVLPFRAQEALGIIAAAAPERFLATNPGKGAIEIEKVIKEHPDRAEWEELGRYLAAGGESYATELDSRWVTRRNFDAALARARARGATNPDDSDLYHD